MQMPSATQVAWAIVAACRETGDDPIAIASGQSKGPSSRVTLRARHYALHALLFVFPRLPREKAAEFVGAPGRPMMFYHGSMNQVAKVVNTMTGRRRANWWDEEGFERVIRAIENAGPKPAIAETTPVIERRQARRDEPEEDDTPLRVPVKLSAAVGSIVEPTRPAAAPGKRKLEDMLRDAVQNTARMTPPPER
jgi:hypothetical protein